MREIKLIHNFDIPCKDNKVYTVPGKLLKDTYFGYRFFLQYSKGLYGVCELTTGFLSMNPLIEFGIDAMAIKHFRKGMESLSKSEFNLRISKAKKVIKDSKIKLPLNKLSDYE